MLQTLQRTAEVAGEIEMTKSHLNKTSEDLQQWVTDVQLWAASSKFVTKSKEIMSCVQGCRNEFDIEGDSFYSTIVVFIGWDHINCH